MTWQILKKEFLSYFYSPIGMIILTVFTAICGLYFYTAVVDFLLKTTPSQYVTFIKGYNVNRHLLIPFFSKIQNLLIIIVPVITMRLFAEEKARALLNAVFIEERGSWAGKYLDSSKTLDKGNIWWMYAELDQMCATLSLKDTSLYTRYLTRTYDYWEDHFIDKKYGEAWFALSENEDVINVPFKSVSFKNGYHTLEHALIGHISTMNYLDKETVLYYAFLREARPETQEIRPYYFEGEVKKLTESKFNNPKFKKYRRAKVVFENVK